MSLTLEQYVRRAVRQARAGLSEEESRIYVEQGLLLVKQAMRNFAVAMNANAITRPHLRKQFTLDNADGTNVNGGYFEIPAAMLPEGLRYAEVYPADSYGAWQVLESPPYQWGGEGLYADFQSVESGLFGQFFVRDNRLYVRDRSQGQIVPKLVLFTVYAPDFSGDYPLPEPLEEKALPFLADLLTPAQPPAPPKNG